MEKQNENEEEIAPICDKCKTNQHVTVEEIIVHLDIHNVWQCSECSLIIERIL